jgi:hypothetical protein
LQDRTTVPATFEDGQKKTKKPRQMLYLPGEIRDQLTKVKPPRQKIFLFKKYISNKPLEIANIFTKGE